MTPDRTLIINPLFFVYVILFLVILAYTKPMITKRLKSWLRHRRHYLDNKSPLLLAFYTYGNEVSSMSNGEIGPVSYRTYFATRDRKASKTYATETKMSGIWAVVYMLELDFNTQAHIVGLGKSARAESANLQQFFQQYKMERVELEGDFGKYFDLFAADGQQTTARYLFDPAAMEAYIDYCRHNFWEIVGDKMYIVSGEQHSDFIPVLKNAQKFVDRIRPALIRTLPGEDPVQHEASYGQHRGEPLKCPLCRAAMEIKDNVHICPKGHGALIFGRDLIRLRKHELILELPTLNPVKHDDIKCPSCGQMMRASEYQNSGAVIDICSGCAYRWLDADELIKIKPASRITG